MGMGMGMGRIGWEYRSREADGMFGERDRRVRDALEWDRVELMDERADG